MNEVTENHSIFKFMFALQWHRHIAIVELFSKILIIYVLRLENTAGFFKSELIVCQTKYRSTETISYRSSLFRVTRHAFKCERARHLPEYRNSRSWVHVGRYIYDGAGGERACCVSGVRAQKEKEKK